MTDLQFGTAGELVRVRSGLGWVTSLIAEAVGTASRDAGARTPTLRLEVERSREPFHDQSWRVVTRGAWSKDGCAVMENVCTSGFDLFFRLDDIPSFQARWRPPRRERAAAHLLRSRFHLVARAALLQYPAMWWAGVRGRVPVHASLVRSHGLIPLLAGPGGVGKSTLLQRAVAAGAEVTTDNLGVTDGKQVWAVVEPLRVAGGAGRRMPHGRRETQLADRRDHDTPDILVAVSRQHRGEATVVRGIGSEQAGDALVGGTFMAGELSRYWAFAATLSSASGLGSEHVAPGDILRGLAASLPCVELCMAHGERRSIGDLLPSALTG